MPSFPPLADPANYVPHTQDLLRDDEARDHWLEHFVKHARAMGDLIVRQLDPADATGRRRADSLREEMITRFVGLQQRPDALGELNVMRLCAIREGLLREHGFFDIYLPTKQEENERALALLPQVLGDVDAHTDRRDQVSSLIRGTFAGNLFDLGSFETIALHEQGGLDFVHWRDQRFKPGEFEGIDHSDRLADFIDEHQATRTTGATGATRGATRLSRVVIFVDNAGSDTILGVLPLARELLTISDDVLLAANELPALNDMTYAELVPLLDRLAFDPRLASAVAEGRLRAVSTGNGLPLIDLSDLPLSFCDASRNAALVVIVGMGRSLETNWTAQFTCPVLRLAVVKDTSVAKSLGLPMFAGVGRFEV